MEKILTRCSHRKVTGERIRKRRKHMKQRMVIAEGLDPISINGNKIIFKWELSILILQYNLEYRILLHNYFIC